VFAPAPQKPRKVSFGHASLDRPSSALSPSDEKQMQY
jgi:hypothetical protein